MNLSWKIMMIPLVATLGFFVYFGFLFFGVRANDRLLTRIQDEFFHAQELSHELESSALVIRHLMVDVMTSGNADLVPEADALAEKFRGDLGACRLNSEMAVSRLDTLSAVFEQYYGLARMTALESAQDTGDLDLDFDDSLLQRVSLMNSSYEFLRNQLREGVENTNDALENALVNARTRGLRLRRTINILSLAFLVALVTLSLGVLRSVMKPVHRLSDATQAIAAGDLNQKLDYQSKDALGQLADSFRDMQAALIEDIRQREAAESDLIAAQGQIIQSEKMAVLGKLVAGLTHELNTPLGALTSSANVVSRSRKILASKCEETESVEELRLDRRFQKALNAMESSTATVDTAAARISELVQGLKAFSQLDQAEQRDTDLNESLQTTYKMIEHQIPESVEVRWELGELPRVLVWPAQLNQLFLALLKRGVEAIEEAGTITIQTRSDESSLEVVFIDTGLGYSPQQIKGLFQPGFKDRSETVRMDWGMVSAAGIATRHQGELSVQSSLENGSTFTLKLPRKTII